MVLITGRQLEHWHTGSMTRRASVLDAIEPDPTALVHPLDLAAMGVPRASVLTCGVASRQGRFMLGRARRRGRSIARGAVFMRRSPTPRRPPTC
jgi:formate dehydrogenase major subunit